MKSFFFSLGASYLFFGLFALIFAAGAGLAGHDAYGTVFREMTATHVISCWRRIAANSPVLLWLIAFALAGGGLLVNTACCAVAQGRSLFKGEGRQCRVRSVQMALIHVAALTVVILHVLDMTVVQRHRPVRLYAGQTVQMAGFRVRAEAVTYVADPSIITEDDTGRRMKSVHLPGDRFSRQDNFVILKIERAGHRPEIRTLKMLSPARTGATYFFLDGFFIAGGSGQVGVLVHHSTNPLVMVFFAVYLVLLGLLVWRYLTPPG